VERSADGKITYVGPEHADARGWQARLMDVFGTSSDAFAISQLNKLLDGSRSAEGAVDATSANSALAVVDGVRPRDEIEAMLAAQMAITHSLAMECLAHAKRVDQIPQLECNGNLAVKLLRTFTVQMEALAKLRRGGEQKVTVEHVHVYPGGKAIVGSVETPTQGASLKQIDQAHALPYAPGATLQGQIAAEQGVALIDESDGEFGVMLRKGSSQ
jgi:hypothetical protein